MKEFFKKDFSYKQLIIVGIILSALSVLLSGGVEGDQLTPFSTILDTILSIGVITIIWGISKFYTDIKVTESRIIAVALSVITITIILVILKSII